MSSRARQWLRQELPSWQQEGLLSAEQVEALTARYRLDEIESGGFWRHLISAAGAILIGLGVILMFAYNWEMMARWMKLGVIFGALVLAHGSALLMLERNRLLSEGLLAIGSMLMGAGIFLVGQIYHLNSHYPDAFLLWAVGILILAWAMESRIQAWMALILVLVWHFSEIVGFQTPNEWVLVPLGLLLPLVFRLDSPMLARFYATALLVSIGGILVARDNPALIPVLLSLGLVLVALPTVMDSFQLRIRRELAEAMAAPALSALVIFLLAVSVEDFNRELLLGRSEGLVTDPLFWISLLASQVLLFVLWLRQQRLEAPIWLAEVILLLVVVPQLAWVYLPQPTIVWLLRAQSLLVNLLTLGLSLWLMISGAREAQRRRLIWGALLFATLVIMRYLDLFDSLIARGLVFLATGVGLFLLSHWYRRSKKEAKP